MIPRTRNVQRYGYGDVLYRILTVDLNANVACTGKTLHQVNAIRFDNGRPAYWYVTDAKARSYGWIA